VRRLLIAQHTECDLFGGCKLLVHSVFLLTFVNEKLAVPGGYEIVWKMSDNLGKTETNW